MLAVSSFSAPLRHLAGWCFVLGVGCLSQARASVPACDVGCCEMMLQLGWRKLLSALLGYASAVALDAACGGKRGFKKPAPGRG